MASPVRSTPSCFEAMESQRLPAALTADLLREIFLRVASPADLARASAACVYFCRIIADPSFIRRYRSLHQPLLLGSIGSRALQPVTAPHPNAAAARKFARTFDFNFRYLPCDVCMCDIRDGRILAEFISYEKNRYLWDLAVCYPLSRQYRRVPPLPEDLLASFQLREHNIFNFETFIVPSGDVEQKSFKLISCMVSNSRVVVFIFTSGSRSWSVGTSALLDSLSLDEPQDIPVLCLRCYVHGCFYWKVNYMNKLLKLDLDTMKLSTLDLPPDHVERSIAIVEAGDGKLAMLSQIDDGASLDYYIFSPNSSKKDGEWNMKNVVSLPSDYRCHMTGRQSEGHIFLSGEPKANDISLSVFFSLETKTFKIEKLSGIKCPGFLIPYFGFPPIISPRRITCYDVLWD